MPCSLSRTLVINLPETMAAYSLVKILISRIEKKKNWEENYLKILQDISLNKVTNIMQYHSHKH